MNNEKKKIGRPTKLTKEIMDLTLKYLGDEGKSIVQLAKELNVSRSTIYYWADNYEEYSYILNKAVDFSEAYWEEKLQECILKNKLTNSYLFGKYLDARFPKTFGRNNKNNDEETQEVSLSINKDEVKKQES